ncbi:MAG TPA: 4'-phosphopantetheinyl transferase superfamily protein [Candidatus Stackebrandtia excrementipullorum]|nr:4'-phosphopantetheinyl transferase superfamily protein [Candidatus Stackebrandtia excrementipullorum]
MTGSVPPHCHVYWANISSASHVPVGLFDADEQARHRAYRLSGDRDRFAVGVWLSRLILGRLLTLKPQEVPLRRDCPRCGQPHGRPRLAAPGPHLSISHSGDIVAVAVSSTDPVGVDVQECSADMPSPDAVMSPRELVGFYALPPVRQRSGFFTVWVRKEAVLKATGDGLNVPLTDLEVSRPDRSAHLVSWRGRPGLAIQLSDLSAPAGYAAALATTGPSRPAIQHRDGTELLQTVLHRLNNLLADIMDAIWDETALCVHGVPGGTLHPTASKAAARLRHAFKRTLAKAVPARLSHTEVPIHVHVKSSEAPERGHRRRVPCRCDGFHRNRRPRHTGRRRQRQAQPQSGHDDAQRGRPHMVVQRQLL